MQRLHSGHAASVHPCSIRILLSGARIHSSQFCIARRDSRTAAVAVSSGSWWPSVEGPHRNRGAPRPALAVTSPVSLSYPIAALKIPITKKMVMLPTEGSHEPGRALRQASNHALSPYPACECKEQMICSRGGVPLDIFNDIFAPARSPSAPPPSSPECLLQGSQRPNALPRWAAQRFVQRSRSPAPAECERSSGLRFSLGKELIERKAHLR